MNGDGGTRLRRERRLAGTFLALVAGGVLLFVGLRFIPVSPMFPPHALTLGEVEAHTGLHFPPGTHLRQAQLQETPGESGLFAVLEMDRRSAERFLGALPASAQTSRSDRLGITETYGWHAPRWWRPDRPRTFVAARLGTGSGSPIWVGPLLLVSLDDPVVAVVYLFQAAG